MSRRYRVALIGDGVRQSFTPAMHEAEAARLGLDYRYDVIDLLELGTTADGIADVARRAGAEVVSGSPADVPPLVADAYIRAKAAGRL